MTVSFIQPLSRAWERMKRVLFEPFDLAKWLVIGFSAWLAGLASGFGGGGRNGTLGDRGGFSSSCRSLGDALDRLLDHVWLLPLVGLAVILVVGLVLLVLWVSSRAKFVYLDNVINNRSEIVEPWTRHREIGNSLFLWRLGFALACFVFLLLLLLGLFAPAATLSVSEALRGLSIAAIVFGFLALAAFVLVAAYVSLFLEAFVVPIMYRYRLKAGDAWRALLPWLSLHAVSFFLYGVFVLLLWALYALVTVALCICCCLLVLPYVGTVVLLPLHVTYRLFSVEFLAQLDPGFELAPAASEVPSA